MDERTRRMALLAGSIGMLLSACGGGGGNTRPEAPPPAAPPAPAPAPAPATPQPPVNAHLALTGADRAQATGLTGAGYAIGVIDSGVNRNHPALQGRVLLNNAYISGVTNNLRVDDVVGHGTTVAQLAAGRAVGRWPGGVAPGATILSARIIADESPRDDGSGKGNEVNGALGLMGVHNDLIRAGMRIMNNSWGGLYWNNPGATAPIASEYRPFITQYDGLVVFAAGNEGRADPTDMAALPSQAGPGGSRPAADLEAGWLTVVALTADGSHSLAHYSNACGIAARYCLAAPGTAVFVDPDAGAGGSTGYYYGSGTSYAAPLVSGAAALVWQAFPYFTNDQVRQTLLGTARDLGDPGIDAVYGHGLLDVATAVRGPMRLDLGNWDVDPGAGDSTWSNPLSGAGGLTKRGSGTLVLASSGNANTGATRVLAGTLDAASLGSGQAQVGQGARLLLRGKAGGGIDNAGTLELDAGAAGGGIAVDGDYVQRSGAALALQVGDVLAVGGAVRLEGGDLRVLGMRDYVGLGQAQAVIEAGGGLSGRFDRLTAPSTLFVEGTLDYTANGVSLTLGRLDVAAAAASLAGISPAALAAAGRVEAAFDRIDAGQADPDAATRATAGRLQAVTDAGLARASLDSLAGNVHGQALAASLELLGNERDLLAARVAGDTAGGSWRGHLDGSLGPGWHGRGWVQGQGLPLSAATAMGFAFGQGRLGAVQARDGRSQDRQTQAHAWLGGRHGRAYWLGLAGTARVDREIDRGLRLGSWQGGAHVRYGLRLDSLAAEAGWQGRTGALDWQPWLGLAVERLRGGDFREADPVGFGLQGRALDAGRRLAQAGLRAHWQGAGWQWQGQLAWRQVLGTHGLDWQARFTGFDAWAGLETGWLERPQGRLSLSARRPVAAGALALSLEQRLGGSDPGTSATLWWERGF